ncbi:MAG: hypothetical protein WBN03_06825 [Desulfobacterales bacterium]
MSVRTCVAPSGQFVYGVHEPHFRVPNLRQSDHIGLLGEFRDGRPVHNHANFPAGEIQEKGAELIFEIPNPFPFRGTTYILKGWADPKARDPAAIKLPEPQPWSFSNLLRQWSGGEAGAFPLNRLDRIFNTLPEPLQLALAATSTDPEDLMRLAGQCCDFVHDPATGRPVGLVYTADGDAPPQAVIRNPLVFDALANNAWMPDDYKEVMVLRPGAQGGSEITADWRDAGSGSHVFEYLRRNSYIPWGHYAANMADDTVRYRIEDLSMADVSGMRHLYYQRTYMRVARDLGLKLPSDRGPLSPETLEALRCGIRDTLRRGDAAARLTFVCTLWGWNFGFDFSPSRYRLHASHQQIHQQYALIPSAVSAHSGNQPAADSLEAYCCGDLIREFTRQYRLSTGRPFFETYIAAIRTNRRMDDRIERENSLVVYEDERVMVFVPKAQTSQWELQLMTLAPVGNILETDTRTRASLDRAILITMKILTALGARMVTVIEYAKRFDSNDEDQRLLYAFLPRLPESPGAFSEAQMRWINGHYPEDFAAACRRRLPEVPAAHESTMLE